MSVLPHLVGPYHLSRILLRHLHKPLDLVLPVLLQESNPNKETRFTEAQPGFQRQEDMIIPEEVVLLQGYKMHRCHQQL